MKLFDDFEAVRFPEENLIFITHGGYLYYIYDVEYKHWRKYRNAGNDHITVRNYPYRSFYKQRYLITHSGTSYVIFIKDMKTIDKAGIVSYSSCIWAKWFYTIRLFVIRQQTSILI